uniref:Uncharacterized protein n=1 Tax=Aegilops tauschii subsp. strangulata TaxID=200361 RepID=A0A452ZBX3_AEGTS
LPNAERSQRSLGQEQSGDGGRAISRAGLPKMEAGSETMDEAGTEMAGGIRRTSRKITKTEYASVLDAMDAAMNQVLEEHMQGLVARWNAENPDATPLVVEALTEEQRESLEREHLAREVLIGQA